MLLFERGKLDLEMPVARVLPEFAKGDRRKEKVTIRMLLAHKSGLPAYKKFYLEAKNREQMLAAACSLQLEAEPGRRSVYSDIGFIVLGEVLQKLAGEAMDQFCDREIFVPLKMEHTCFVPSPERKKNIAPTLKDDSFRHRTIQGEVHDENASAMGGVAGHAGLFGTAGDLASFAQCMLRGGEPILKAETVRLFTSRPANAIDSYALGWDTPSSPSQSGRYFSKSAFGHLGYTGTSLWIDPEKRIAIILLTNRIWADDSSQKIKEIRPAFHDAVMEALQS
jgi:CubicO group peptidase (beta-lactamase class C family)